MGFQTGWRLWTAKPLWNCRKIQRNHGYRDTHLWRFPVDLKRVYSLGHKQGHKMFPERDTHPATFVLALKSFRVSSQCLRSQIFLAWHPKDFDELAPAPLPASHQHCRSPLPPCTLHSSKSKPPPVPRTCSAISEAFSGESPLTWLRFPSPIWLFSFRTLHVVLSQPSYSATLFPVYSENPTAQADLLSP